MTSLIQRPTLLLIATFGCALSGCATTPNDLVGHIGCPASQITISHYKRGLNADSYQATCGKHRYLCTTANTSSDTPTIACARTQTA